MCDTPKKKIPIEYVRKTDPDLLLALDKLTDAIKDLKPDKPEPPMSISELESFSFPGEKPQKWWEALLPLVLVIALIFCAVYAVNSCSGKLKASQEQVGEVNE